MSVRSAVRGLVLVTAGAALALGVAVALSPGLRRRASALAGRTAEPEPQQPTHIVLPDRPAQAHWDELDEAIEEGRSAGDVALAGA